MYAGNADAPLQLSINAKGRLQTPEEFGYIREFEKRIRELAQLSTDVDFDPFGPTLGKSSARFSHTEFHMLEILLSWPHRSPISFSQGAE
jgi:hypothetical protein